MKIAIHERYGSFSDEWIRYCKEHNVDYKIVDCYCNDIISQLEGCAGLMWHWAHFDGKGILFARQLTYSLEHIGIKVFPDSKTCWHFDDKVGQKYLLEAIKAPLVPTMIFYDKKEAKDWVKNASFPKVFKLRGGASSVNVKLVKNRTKAIKLINRAFGKGFRIIGRMNSLKDRFINLQKEQNLTALIHLFKGLVRLIFPEYDERIRVREKGYIYFQEFIPDNKYDIRIVIIGDKAFAIKRMIRNNDFRASGGGNKNYTYQEISSEYIESAFLWSEKLDMQCVAFDFLRNNKKIFLTEISYGFVTKEFPGFWDKELNWHEVSFKPAWFMIENFLNSLK